jgi:hypothetical protein
MFTVVLGTEDLVHVVRRRSYDHYHDKPELIEPFLTVADDAVRLAPGETPVSPPALCSPAEQVRTDPD